MQKLTARQAEILGFVNKCINEDKFVPTCQQIADHFKFSRKAARDHVYKLIEKGYVDRAMFKTRSLELSEKPKVYPNGLLADIVHAPSIVNINRDVIELPIFRHVSVTPPHLHTKFIEGILPLAVTSIEFFKEDCFGFKFQDESMIRIGILPGDIVICRLVEEAGPSDIVIACVNRRTLLRRVYYNNDEVILIAENGAVEPQNFNVECVDIVAQYIGLWRPKLILSP